MNVYNSEQVHVSSNKKKINVYLQAWNKKKKNSLYIQCVAMGVDAEMVT